MVASLPCLHADEVLMEIPNKDTFICVTKAVNMGTAPEPEFLWFQLFENFLEGTSIDVYGALLTGQDQISKSSPS